MREILGPQLGKLLHTLDPLSTQAAQQVRKLAVSRGLNATASLAGHRVKAFFNNPRRYFTGDRLSLIGLNSRKYLGKTAWDKGGKSVRDARVGAAKYLGAWAGINAIDSDSNVAWGANTAVMGVAAYGAWSAGRHHMRKFPMQNRRAAAWAGGIAVGFGALYRFGVL